MTVVPAIFHMNHEHQYHVHIPGAPGGPETRGSGNPELTRDCSAFVLLQVTPSSAPQNAQVYHNTSEESAGKKESGHLEKSRSEFRVAAPRRCQGKGRKSRGWGGGSCFPGGNICPTSLATLRMVAGQARVFLWGAKPGGRTCGVGRFL